MKNTTTEMYKTPWVRNGDLRTRIEFGWHYIEGNGEAYWSVTHETQSAARGYWEEDSCGSGMPEGVSVNAAVFISRRWHLASATEPMHYVANAKYWFSYLAGTNQFRLDSNIDPTDAFKSTVVFGALPDDEMPQVPELPEPPPSTIDFTHEPKEAARLRKEHTLLCRKIVNDAVTAWCNARIERLREVMKTDTDAAIEFGRSLPR